MVSVTHEEQLGLNSPAEPGAGDSRIPKCGDCILLVEDDMPTLRLERVILEEAGYLVQGAASGEAALEHIAEEPPALVILDNGLPGMDGFTTCRRIREFSQVPVVMVTGNKTAAHRKQGKASGADAYVTKPFLADHLVDLVAEYIAESAENLWKGESSQPVDTSPSDPQLANAPAPLAAEDAAQPDGGQPDGRQPIASGLPRRNGHSPAPADEEEPEEDATEVAVVWTSQDFQEQQSPLEDPDSENSLPWYGDEPEQDVYQPAPASEVAFDQGESPATSSLMEQPPRPADNREDDSAFAPPALPIGDLSETANEDQDPDQALAEGPTAELDRLLYEGTVRLIVTSSGPVKNLLNFVGELRQNTQLRLLRLVATQRSQSMDIWLGLREPLHLLTILGDIPGASQVAALPDSDGDEEERRVTVAVGQ